VYFLTGFIIHGCIYSFVVMSSHSSSEQYPGMCANSTEQC